MAVSCFNLGGAALAQAEHHPPGLRALADRRGLRLGTAVRIGLLQPQTDGGRYEGFINANFNMVEPDNSLKPPAVRRDKNVYDLSAPDALLGVLGQMGWAQQHHMAVRGHTLIYGRDDGWTLPGWLVTEPGRVVSKTVEDGMTKAEAKGLLRRYIYAVAGRYKGKVAMWDVINETVDDAQNSSLYNLRDSFWFRKLGPEFVALAFRWAHEADPSANLYYNDYGIEGPGRKANAVFALVKLLKAQGVPITGVGMQWHVDVNTSVAPVDGHYRVAQRLKDNGMDFMVTELDVAVPIVVYPKGDPRYGLVPVHSADLNEQGRVYDEVLRYALRFPNYRGVNVWEFTDRYSRIPDFTIGRLKQVPPGVPQGAATLLDSNYQPKPAYLAVRRVLALPE